ncbi:MAG TPA: hypothetical protein PLV92_08055 [Pirellulaceae bacterium]|nr:hypothetical protein [Pirellulaceae bacterium]
MAQKHRFNNKRDRGGNRAGSDRRAAPLPAYQPPPVITYGPVVLVLEDEQGRTFEFQNGAMVPFGMSMAECRRTCQVKELAQKIKEMTRYEVRRPI